MDTIRIVLVKNTWLPDGLFGHGWGNGYVGVPKGHPWFGVYYEDIKCNVHGGLTFSEMDDFGEGYWWVGFDTAHYSDNKDNCDLTFVSNEVESLAEQARNAAH